MIGAALGNGLSFVIGALLLIVFWLSNQLSVKYSTIFDLDLDRVKEIFKVGLPAALEQVIFQIGITAFLILVAYYGTEAYAAYGIGVQILSFSFVIICLIFLSEDTSELFDKYFVQMNLIFLFL